MPFDHLADGRNEIFGGITDYPDRVVARKFDLGPRQVNIIGCLGHGAMVI
jgi:hypothetical protein